MINRLLIRWHLWLSQHPALSPERQEQHLEYAAQRSHR